jgi:dienelactone hydrolase
MRYEGIIKSISTDSKYLILMIFLYPMLPASAQPRSFENAAKNNSIVSKPIIDSVAINSWPFFGGYLKISNDGKYFTYNYSKGLGNENILIVSSADTLWQMQFPGADFATGFFSSDSKSFIFKRMDTLYFVNLHSKAVRKVANVVSIKLPESNTGEWLAYQLKGEEKTTIAFNLLANQHAQFENIDDYFFNKNGSALLLKMSTHKNEYTTTSLKWISLPPCKVVDIYECSSPSKAITKSISGITFSPSGYQVAFIVKNIDSTPNIHNANTLPTDQRPTHNELWYYASDMNAATLKATDQSEGILKNLTIAPYTPTFSKNGEYIYFNLQQISTSKENRTGIMVDVWNYRDTLLQCTQLNQPPFFRLTAAVHITDNRVIQLSHEFENILVYAEKKPLVVVNFNTRDDRFWLKSPDTNWLVSLLDGTRTRLAPGYKQFSFSPEGKYLIYYDVSDYNYYSLELNTYKTSKISDNIPSGFLALKSEFYKEYPDSFPYMPIGIAAWEANDTCLYVYDQYDIWRLDPSGKNQAINVTNGYGHLHHIQFRLTYGMVNSNIPIVVNSNESILLSAFNTINKYNGFYTSILSKQMEPRLLHFGPYVYDLSSHNQLPLNAQNFFPGYGMPPIKAKNAEVWIIKRQSNTDAPNYYITSNLKTFRPLTNFRPQANYNWLTADLIEWQQPDGTQAQGILYKPENFDPSQKYPVIFNYYQQRSHRLYQYPSPAYSIANIDVAWFVSRGYLVFTPDIHFKYGQPGWSAFNTMTSAVMNLAKLPYVNALKIAINGHSVAGGLTNFIITHTNKFAAAIECAGVSNTISAALQLGGMYNEESRLGGAEFSLGRVSIWQNPSKYLEASPIMNADKVLTPLLIMHNKTDGGVPWGQALELFLALRRLEKPVWMLQYDKGNHSLWGQEEEAKDFTIRITQFFDHYLKERPAPRWMVNGIPAKLKGIEMGYELVESK